MKVMIAVLLAALMLGGGIMYSFFNDKEGGVVEVIDKPAIDSQNNDYKVIGDDKDTLVEQNRSKVELERQKNKEKFDRENTNRESTSNTDLNNIYNEVKRSVSNKLNVDAIKQRAAKDIDTAQKAVDNVLQQTNVEYPISPSNELNIKANNQSIDSNHYIWQDSVLSSVSQSVETPEQIAEQDKSIEDPIVPRFTIAANSIFSTVNTTALLGRIPIDGQVQDAFRFSLKIKDVGLFANHHKHNKLNGVVLSGTASGDLLLSCVRASIDSITYIFDDGLISQNNGADIATITDKFGYPCIKGELVTNAPQNIATTSLLSGLSSAAKAIADAEKTTSTDSSGNSSSQITGDSEKFGIYSALSGVMNNTHEWVNQRAKSSFDVIVAPAGQDISLYFNQQIDIDYDPNGRRLIHQVVKNKEVTNESFD